MPLLSFHAAEQDDTSGDWRPQRGTARKRVIGVPHKHSFVFVVLCVTVVGVLLAFAPWTTHPLAIVKQVLIIAGAGVGLLVWIARGIRQKEFFIVRTPFDVLFLGLCVVWAVSAIFSYVPGQSIFSISAKGVPSLLAFIFLALFFVLIVNTVRTRAQGIIILCLIVSAGIVAELVALAGYFRVIPWISSGFNTIGTQLDIAVVAAVIAVVCLGFVVSTRGWGWKVFGISGVVISCLLLHTIGFTLSWVFLLIGSALLLACVLAFRYVIPVRTQWVWMIYAVVLVSALSLFISIPPITGTVMNMAGTQLEVPTEVRLSFGTSWDIAMETIFDTVKKAVIGSGQGTFGHMFSQHRPKSFNETAFWNVRFAESYNVFLEALTTTGIAGLLALVLLIVAGLGFAGLLVVLIAFPATSRFVVSSAFFQAQRFIQQHRARYREQGLMFMIFAAGLAVMTVSFFFIVPSITVWFLWVVVLGLTVSLFDSIREKSTLTVVNIQESAHRSMFLSFGFVTGIVIALFGTVYLARVVYADVNFQTVRHVVVQLNVETPDYDTARVLVARAIRLNNDYAPYFLASAQLNLAQAVFEARKPSDQFDKGLFQALVAGAINDSKTAVDLDRNNVTIWEERANVFENVMPFVPDALSWALKSYEEGLLREPTNPRLQFKIGYLKTLSAVDKDQKIINESAYSAGIADMEKAVIFAPSFFEARIAIARAYEKSKDMDKALRILEDGMFIAGVRSQPVMYFELARLYYNTSLEKSESQTDTLDRALAAANTALELSPDYANALYTRALIFDKQGLKDKALADAQTLEKANTNNDMVKTLVDRLKKGESASEDTSVDGATGLEGEEDEVGRVKGEKVDEENPEAEE